MRSIRIHPPLHKGPLTTIEDVEYVAMAWIDWFNSRRLHSELGLIQPTKFEANYYAPLWYPN